MVNDGQIGLWVDADVLHSTLSLKEKVILADIIVLSKGGNRCFKLNTTFAKTYSMSVRTVQVVLASLVGLDEAQKTLGSMAPTYFVAVAGIVAAFFGAQAYAKK